ncbi:RecQ family ATP-dependent DNA helicase [Thioalkalivibrio sp. ALE11]|uniref:RecQ family ATP-dependent DNA helicase n=1 Tax=Thioalkalivibrio sp. ALE11 TaxID=1265494 RepID=UPI00037E3E3B|nr:RecQ family ATP-dependent DNA helicase [Thioalkalivibrio sp. ALE11]
MEKLDAEALLKTALGDDSATFRPGQWEAIDALVNQRRKLLVVQRTGWGKSSVYFISTRLLRDRGFGATIIISPLLALMRNQIESARRLGIRAATINSANQNQEESVKRDLLAGQVDCLLISPERLANDTFVQSVMMPIADRIGLLVVDEAHCISDWGHDFRPDYRRIVGVLRQLPPGVPVLGTTATANDRVIEDVRSQLGDVVIQRGSLERESLALQALRLPDQASRLAWMVQVIPTLPGTGIVYTLTTRDAQQVADWLQQHGIEARAYYADVTPPEWFQKKYPNDRNQYREYLEDQLLRNELKVLVATGALGMGYDKPDLGFVIHYQAPGSIVAYYQQVGRAGRAIDSALGILIAGHEDDEIHEYFRRSACPSDDEIRTVLATLEESDGLSIGGIEQNANLKRKQIDKTLKILSVECPSPVIKEGSVWRRTPVAYRPDYERIRHLTEMREREWQQVNEYINTSGCLMNFLRGALDDPQSEPCGRCANCLGESLVPNDVDSQLAHQAATYQRQAEMPIKPKKQVAAQAFQQYGFRGNLPANLQAQEGRVLSRWNDGGWGGLVKGGKQQGTFGDELVEAMAEMVEQRWQPQPPPTWLCSVPSLNHPELVPDFARRLAARLGIRYVEAVRKVADNEPQKMQQNRFHQCRNLDGVFEVDEELPSAAVLLVDDIVDSGWTMTVVAALLRRAGSGEVFPVALASSSGND